VTGQINTHDTTSKPINFSVNFSVNFSEYNPHGTVLTVRESSPSVCLAMRPVLPRWW